MIRNVSQETADRIFRNCDTSGDNRVSLTEFRAMLAIGDSHAKEKCPKCSESSKSLKSRKHSSNEPKMLPKSQRARSQSNGKPKVPEAKGTGSTKISNPIDTSKTKNIAKGCRTDLEAWGPTLNREFFEKRRASGLFEKKSLLKKRWHSKI